MYRLDPLLYYVFAILIVFETAAQEAAPAMISQLEVYSLQDDKHQVVYTENAHFEAPNWSPDGAFFIINQNGRLYSVSRLDSVKTPIHIRGLTRLNNDHGPSFDGNWLAVSNNDSIPGKDSGTSRIYVVPLKGGTPVLVTSEMPSYWHGWSPDGQRLVYTAARNGVYDIYEIDIDSKQEVQITNSPTLDDGPEYSSDGAFLYFNSYRSGSMEIWRRETKSGRLEQLTNDVFSNWFPHPSPDGRYVVFLSYVKDQKQGHPALKKVRLRLMDLSTLEIRSLCEFIGGQGTINVPSWAPDSRAFAFVSYIIQ